MLKHFSSLKDHRFITLEILFHEIIIFLQRICLFFFVSTLRYQIKNNFFFLVVNLTHLISLFTNYVPSLHLDQEHPKSNKSHFLFQDLRNTKRQFHEHVKCHPLPQQLQSYLDSYLIQLICQYFIQFLLRLFSTFFCLNCTYRHILLTIFHLTVFLVKKLDCLNYWLEDLSSNIS